MGWGRGAGRGTSHLTWQTLNKPFLPGTRRLGESPSSWERQDGKDAIMSHGAQGLSCAGSPGRLGHWQAVRE